MPNLTVVLPCLKRLGHLYDTLAFSLLGKIGPVGLRQLLNTILVIGPEGGFSDAEITLFHEHGIKSVKSSGHILRTETAAVALAAQWLAT